MLVDLNATPIEVVMEEFMKVYSLKDLVKEPACFKNPDRPSCINLILTDKDKSFQESQIIENGLADFHKKVLTVLEVYFEKKGVSVIEYDDYNDSNQKFRNDLPKELIRYKIETCRIHIFFNSVKST